MAKYNVHAGHNSIVPGASKYLNEVTENRKVKNKVIQLLKAAGHTVYDCTDDSGRTVGANLANIVAKCNKHTVDLDISIHLNAGGGTGTEVFYYTGSATGKTKAAAVSQKVAAALGIRNRGAKASSGLYVLRNTKATAILVECCFVDSKTDQGKWNVDKCAAAIVEAITGKAASSGSSGSGSDKPAASTGKKSTDTIAKEVIAGEWGNGNDRKKKLEAAGYNYNTIQNRVNEMLGVKASSSSGSSGSTKKTLKVGMKAKPKTAVSYDGVKLISSVTKKYYKVIEVKGSRVVLGDGLNTAFNISNLTY